MTDYEQVLKQIENDQRYQRNLDWGKPRKGHPEGSVREHIRELESNLNTLQSKLNDEDYWKLKILIHSHDTFKAESKRGVRICDHRSHALIARAFLAQFCDDADLLAMVQFHDEPYALWRQFESREQYDSDRFDRLLATISDWDLFLTFLIVDGCTQGKRRDPLVWFFDRIAGQIDSSVSAGDIL